MILSKGCSALGGFELQYNKEKFRGPIGTGKKPQNYANDMVVKDQIRAHEENIRRDRDISTI